MLVGDFYETSARNERVTEVGETVRLPSAFVLHPQKCAKLRHHFPSVEVA